MSTRTIWTVDTVPDTKGVNYLHATCHVCGAKSTHPDKGLGRANLAAWKTRHQHREEGW